MSALELHFGCSIGWDNSVPHKALTDLEKISKKTS